MTPDQIANIAGTIILLLSGIGALFLPKVLGDLLALGMGRRGTAEIRINFGAFWIGLAAAALLLNDSNVYTVLGAGWGAIVLVRLLAYLIDRPDTMRWYWLLLAGEIITTILLVV
ncbi:MAG: hypothetical protein SF123_17335 [Chloroflexota bacterium]|nr:hypothetical protein [Chloroflexota bacterium]